MSGPGLAEVLKDYRVVELSHVLEEGMPRPQVPYGHIPWKSYGRGDAFNTNMVLVFEHAGTHVDAPVHLGGVDGPGLDGIPAEAWMGELAVLGFRRKGGGEAVTVEDIRGWEVDHGDIEELDLFQQLQAVHSGHFDISDDHMIGIPFHHLQGLHAVTGLTHSVTFTLQHSGKQEAHPLFVINNHYMDRWFSSMFIHWQ